MKTFGEFFGPYIELSRYPESMHHGELTGLQIDTRNRVLTAKVAFPALVDRNTLFHAEKEIASCKTLQLHRAVLDPQFPQECFTVEYYPNLVQELKRRDASINGTLNQSSARLEGDKLIVTLSHGGGNLLLSRHADRLLSDIIREEFGVSVQVEFDGTLTLDSDSVAYIEKQKKQEETLRREAVVQEIEEYEQSMEKSASPKKQKKCISVRTPETMLPTVLLDTAKELYGRPAKAKPVPISRITPDIGSVTVWGEIFSVDSKLTRDQNRKIYSINITDYTSSITLKIIELVAQCKMLDTLKKGMSILVRGDVEYDKYDREIVLRPKGISTVEQLKVVDDAPEKRVELHLHTNMSSMDGVSSAGDLIERAYAWGQPAIAITDHGVAQAFPDAMNALERITGKGGKFKVIYGVESYFINDMVPAVTGHSSNTLDDEFISFDIETTGLSPNKERITEIGAVRIRNGEVVESFDTFVNPQMPIPPKIT